MKRTSHTHTCLERDQKQKDRQGVASAAHFVVAMEYTTNLLYGHNCKIVFHSILFKEPIYDTCTVTFVEQPSSDTCEDS